MLGAGIDHQNKPVPSRRMCSRRVTQYDTQMTEIQDKITKVPCEKNKILMKFHIQKGPETASMRWHLALALISF